ncbi:MAG: hypothetical protein ACRDAM_06065 [Casimicrobium sp.]
MGAKAFSAQFSTFSIGETGTAITGITAITKANPAVATKTAHGLTGPKVVKISAVVGMTEINGLVAVARPLNANEIELSGVDSTSFTTYSGSAGTLTPSLLKLGGWSSWSNSDDAAERLETTDLDDQEKTYLTGLSGAGSMTLNMQRIYTDDGQAALIASKFTPGINLPLVYTAKTPEGVETLKTTGGCASFGVIGSGGVNQIVNTTATINLGGEWKK